MADITGKMLQQAIDLYLQRAYENPGQIPDSVRQRIGAIQAGLQGVELMGQEVFERLPADSAVAEASRFNLRLGNIGYLHMKLGIDRVSGTDEFVFVVDTHDKHFAALVQGGEQDQYKALVDRNAGVKEAIETAWTAAGLPTFQGYLRQRLKAMKNDRHGGRSNQG